MDKVEKLLREFAGEIGTTVKELWPHAISHFYWSALQGIIAASFIWFVMFVLLILNKDKKYWVGEKFDSAPTLKFFAMIIFLAATLAVTINLSINLADVIEPEGGLLRRAFKL